MAGPVRLFVALYPPAATSVRLLAALEPLQLPPHRRVAPDHVHMTLVFIGDTAVGDIERVRESVERSAAGIPAFDLTPTRLCSLPSGREARLVAAETTAPSPLIELQRRLAARLAKPSAKERGRPFLPHITLVRFATPISCDVSANLAPSDAFPVSTIHLVQSHLRPGGAEHHLIAAIPLRNRLE